MPTYDFKGDKVKASKFEKVWDEWIVDVDNMSIVFDMGADTIQRLYDTNELFKQFVDKTRIQEKYLDKVRDALQK